MTPFYFVVMGGRRLEGGGGGGGDFKSCSDSWLVASPSCRTNAECVYVCVRVRSSVNHNVSKPARGPRRVPPPAPSPRRALAPPPEESLTFSASFYVSARPAAARGRQEFVHGFTPGARKLSALNRESGSPPPGRWVPICFHIWDQFRPRAGRRVPVQRGPIDTPGIELESSLF